MPSRPTLRWWPAATILVLAAIALIWIWAPASQHRQSQVMASFPVLFFTFVLLLLWFVFLSRLRWKLRGLGLGVLLVLGVVAFFGLEFRGVTGDLVPRLGWRGSREAARTAPSPEAGSAGPATDVSFPQFLGAGRDATLRGVRLARDWKSTPPRELWRISVGEAWSGFAVAEGRAVTHEQRGEQEMVTCYDLVTGRLLWSHADETRHEDPIGGAGPRGTPAIASGQVFTYGGTGILNALDLVSGRRLWSRDVLRDHAGHVPIYGVSTSPLVLDDRVIVQAGGPGGHSLVAYDLETGEPAWSGGDDSAAYSSPTPAHLVGMDQILQLGNASLTGHAREDGRVLWSVPWPGDTEKVSQPVVLPGDRVFLSTGYGVGGRLFQVRGGSEDGFSAELLWQTLGLKAKFTNVVHRGGFLYGLDDGILACIDANTGERRWKGGRYGHGQILLADDLLVVQSEKGFVALVEAVPDEHRELARLPALDDKTWNHPALAGPYLLVRNDREAACYELPLAR